MKTMCLITLALIFCMSTTLLAQSTRVETTINLIIFYPNYSRIDLVCGKMPDKSDANVVFCCEAAFTGQLLPTFNHTNIADDHVCDGLKHKGYACKANTGGFVWKKDGKWMFVEKDDYLQMIKAAYMGFGQVLIVYKEKIMPKWAQKPKAKNVYRALCERNGKLCVIQSRKTMEYEFFIKCLQAYGVTHALYLDMGAGWNYAWYRDTKDGLKELFPESKKSSNYKYRTNWITLYK